MQREEHIQAVEEENRNAAVKSPKETKKYMCSGTKFVCVLQSTCPKKQRVCVCSVQGQMCTYKAEGIEKERESSKITGGGETGGRGRGDRGVVVRREKESSLQPSLSVLILQNWGCVGGGSQF